MAGSEVGGVPGGLVMVVGERPGETRNNVLPSHLLHSRMLYFWWEATVWQSPNNEYG